MASRIDRVSVLFLCLTLCVLACSHQVETEDSNSVEGPNIILVLADDLGWGDLRAYHPRSVIPTPNIDRLAREGMRFTDAHSSSSVCSPSRYSLLTGRYAWRARDRSRALRYFAPPLIEKERLTLPELLRSAGYATAAIGKWHLGMNVPAVGGGHVRRRDGRVDVEPDFSAPIEDGPLDFGFDSYFGAQLENVRAFVRDRHFVGTPRRTPSGKFRVDGWREAQKGKTHLAEALRVVERLHTEDSNRPFFLYFATHYPHQPYAPAVSIDGTPVRGTSGAGPRGDLVVELDVVLGRLLDQLDALGIARETLIILTSDNGPAAGLRTEESGDHDPSGIWRGGKGSIWEGGHRVPFVARWGDGTDAGSIIPPGTVSDQLIGLQDLMATVAELIDASLPADAAEDSVSFRSALDGNVEVSAREHMVYRSAPGQFAVRSGDWKLIRSGPSVLTDRRAELGPDGPRLYNLVDDPSESVDLTTQNADTVKRLEALFEAVVGVSDPATASSPAPAAARSLRH